MANASCFALTVRGEESIEMAQSLMVTSATDMADGSTELCDRCGVGAKLGLVLPTGGELSFCGHHANRYAETILATAESVFLDSGFDWRGTSVRPRYVGAHRVGAPVPDHEQYERAV
jgi:hypothetical protein